MPLADCAAITPLITLPRHYASPPLPRYWRHFRWLSPLIIFIDSPWAIIIIFAITPLPLLLILIPLLILLILLIHYYAITYADAIITTIIFRLVHCWYSTYAIIGQTLISHYDSHYYYFHFFQISFSFQPHWIEPLCRFHDDYAFITDIDFQHYAFIFRRWLATIISPHYW